MRLSPISVQIINYMGVEALVGQLYLATLPQGYGQPLPHHQFPLIGHLLSLNPHPLGDHG